MGRLYQIYTNAIIPLMISCGQTSTENNDADAEEGVCSPIPGDPFSGIGEQYCNAIDKCGCEDDWCCLMITPIGASLSCLYYASRCCAGETGTLSVGQECPFPPNPSDGSYCEEGTVCLPESVSSIATCRELCKLTSDCHSGTCVPGPEEIAIPDDYSLCLDSTTVSLYYWYCSDE